MAKNTLKDVVKEARARGIKITTRKRSDGGIRITKINGHRADQAEINYLRALTGKELSGKQLKQRTYARGRILPKKVRKAYERFLEISKAAESNFTVKRSTVLMNVRRKGATATAEYLGTLTAQALGYASHESLESLLAMMRASAANWQNNGTVPSDYYVAANSMADLLETLRSKDLPPDFGVAADTFYEVVSALDSYMAFINIDPPVAYDALESAEINMRIFINLVTKMVS